MSVAAVFLGKDGTLVENVPYNADSARVRSAPEVGPALARLLHAGFRLFVVSNQPGVALDHFPLAALTPLSQRMLDLAHPAGATLHGFYYCPHAPAGAAAIACGCRKPAPGLLLQAAAQHDIDLAASWMVGDILDDVEAGHRAGCRSVLVDNGNETEWVRSALRIADYVARDFADAAAHVAAHVAGGRGRHDAPAIAEHAR